jgi:photosystem II stability/assembly factor-like uncharacterized protein
MVVLSTHSPLESCPDSDSATFSADSFHATFITGSAVQIYGRDSNGEWTQNTIIHHNASLLTAIFSPDSSNLLITDEGTQIYELDSSGSTWTNKAAIEPFTVRILLADFYGCITAADYHHKATIVAEGSS